jgi:hypothetical protein
MGGKGTSNISNTTNIIAVLVGGFNVHVQSMSHQPLTDLLGIDIVPSD